MSKQPKPAARPEVKYDPESDLPSLRGPREAAAFAGTLGINVSPEILYHAMRDGELSFYKIGNRHDLAPADVVAYLRGRRHVPADLDQ